MTILGERADKSVFLKYETIIKESFKVQSPLRISDADFDLSSLTDKEKAGIVAEIVHTLQQDAKKLNWDAVTVKGYTFLFIGARQLLKSLGNLPLFYHIAGIFFDRLASSDFFQPGRDIVEEIGKITLQNGPYGNQKVILEFQ